MTIRNFIDTSTLKSVFSVCDIDNKRAILNDNVSSFIHDDDIIYIHDVQYGNYIYTKGHLYGGALFNGQTDDQSGDENIKLLKDDVHDIAEFVYDQHTKISKNTDSINIIKNKVENEFKTYNNKFDTLDKTLDILDNYTGMIFDVSIFTQNALNYNSILPAVSLLDDCSLNSYPEDFLNNYVYSVLNNNLDVDMYKLLNRTCQVFLRCYNVSPWISGKDNYYIIPGTFISCIVDSEIEYPSGDVIITRPARYIMQQIISNVGQFVRVMEITYEIFRPAFIFTDWKYFKTIQYISKDKIIHDFVTNE